PYSVSTSDTSVCWPIPPTPTLPLVSTGSSAPSDLPSFPTRRSSDLDPQPGEVRLAVQAAGVLPVDWKIRQGLLRHVYQPPFPYIDRKSTRLNSSHVKISYAVFCLKKKTRARQAGPPHPHRDRRAARH